MNLPTIFRNQYFIVFIILILINITLNGCYSFNEITPAYSSNVKIYKIEKLNGEIVDFKNTKWGYAAIIDSNVVTIKSNGEKEEFPTNNVKKYYTEKLNVANTLLLSLGCAVLVVGIIILATFKPVTISGPIINKK